ncbi:MAG: D-alanyl-D-alanine carboxypeptidase family protein [Steroidobacteraceae bacterium]
MTKLKWTGVLGCIMLTLAACKKSESPAAVNSASSAASTSSSGSPLESFSKSPLESLPTATAGATPAVLPAGMPIPPAPAVDARGYIIMDAASGQVLAENNSGARLEPASLTKLMTSYIVFDALRIGKLKLTDMVTISEHAWREGGAGSDGSTSFLPIGSQVPVEVLIQGMIVQSGNDASIALAEHIAGNEDTFAQLMRQYAQRLGMSGSSFGNATGLPSPLDYTTPRDMSLLAQALVRDFPEYYHFFSEKEFTYNGITQHNRNGLLRRDPTVDGLKTGHTENAGYCLVTSAKRSDMRLITVVMGTPSIKAREEGTSALLNYGFSFYETKRMYAANQVLQSAKVRKGVIDSVAVGPNSDVQLTLQRGRAADVQASVELPAALVAPLKRDTAVGKLKLTLAGKELGSYPLYPQADVTEAGFFGRMIDSIRLWFE